MTSIASCWSFPFGVGPLPNVNVSLLLLKCWRNIKWSFQGSLPLLSPHMGKCCKGCRIYSNFLSHLESPFQGGLPLPFTQSPSLHPPSTESLARCFGTFQFSGTARIAQITAAYLISNSMCRCHTFLWSLAMKRTIFQLFSFDRALVRRSISSCCCCTFIKPSSSRLTLKDI